METLGFPARYQLVARLGGGGGGEVFTVRDRVDGRLLALKTLADDASENEAQALVREAIALSGLEGLGLPRVLQFGRLPKTGRPFLVRELIQGKSLAELIAEGAPLERCLLALTHAAEQLTVLHRASLFHGDIKPANIIVGEDGRATLVDLGLASSSSEGKAFGLSPRYAAPELFEGAKPGVRPEIFAIGASLKETLEKLPDGLPPNERAQVEKVAARAMSVEPSARFPSADEFASELRRAAKLEQREAPVDAEAWPIIGIDGATEELLAALANMKAGEALIVRGPAGSGKSTMARRAAWSLSISGQAVEWLEAASDPTPDGEALVFVDDADLLDESGRAMLERARRRGHKLVLIGAAADFTWPSAASFALPPLDPDAARSLVARAIPSLSESLLAHLVAKAGARPGPLRAMVRKLKGAPLVRPFDIDALLDASSPRPDEPPLERVRRLLDQGHFDEAALALDALADDTSLGASVARARLALGRGDAEAALSELRASASEAERARASHDGQLFLITEARAKLRLGDYAKTEELSRMLLDISKDPALLAEALTLLGLAHSYTDAHEEARLSLERSVALAKEAKAPRVESLALASLALAHQRRGELDRAFDAYRRALDAAEAAEDASTIATIRLNLATIAQSRGDIAETIACLEAAIDMGERAGRQATVRQARINLANLEIHLGRHARARTSIEAVAEERERLSQAAKAQLLGLEAFLASRTGAMDEAIRLFEASGDAYEALGRGLDAAEAWLEGLLLRATLPKLALSSLVSQLDRAKAALGEASAHRALVALAEGALARAKKDEARALERFDRALEAAEASGQKEWIVRALESRASLFSSQGRALSARKDLERALLLLEEFAAALPNDLREVFWDDPPRHKLRSAMEASSPTQTFAERQPPASPKDDRLARILEINRKLAGVHDLDRLVDRITDHAVALLEAEHGFVLLTDEEGQLTVQASRDRQGDDDPHARFSRSIAERVIGTGEAVVSRSVKDDVRLEGYASVHQMMLKSVACAPIRSPGGRAIGALYLETRLKPGSQFDAELPTLGALADQVAIAIENARLVTESAAREAQLEEANKKLVLAQQKLEELLGDRTAQLDRTRRDLDRTREVLEGRFGYAGLVGQSAAMRRVYALIDRIKDTDVPVLVTGESGTGKEVVARAIHDRGPRGKKPFVGVNCGAIPEHLLESELFGHVRGAFTGADRERKGLFREGEGGTILLDEIGEMPQKMQAGLLRVLQEKLVRPVGGPRELPVDVRVIAATNRKLEQMVREGSFREDLFYRLNVVEVRLPALRERQDDIPLLVDHFLGIFSLRYKREKRTLAREALRMLTAYPWPGNIRQLENALLNAWVTSDRSELQPEDFDLPSQDELAPRVKSLTPPEGVMGSVQLSEKERILRALEETGWNRVKASEKLGIPRRTFYRRLKEYGIQ